jgi:diadenosine tetraphosphate (Ap4A) HIT family hydrolase
MDHVEMGMAETLIVPRRHESDFLALSGAKQAAIWALVPGVCRQIEARHRPVWPAASPML